MAFAQQKYPVALDWYKKSEETLQSTNRIKAKLEIKHLIAQVYEKQGKFNLAIPLYKKYYTMLDSISLKNKVDKLAEIEAKLVDQENESKIALLQKNEEVLSAKNLQMRIIAFSVGALALLIFVFFWNTRRKNKTISLQNHQLEQLNLTKDRLFAIIGHDIRKPVIAFRSIVPKINYLLKKKDYAGLNQLGESIEQDALALNKLTDNLMNWALLQKNVMPYHPEEVNLSLVVNEILSIFSSTAKLKDITLKSSIEESVEVYADPNALRAIIRNLVDNALKFTPENGKVLIEAKPANEGVHVNVADTGIGMSQNQVRDIFLLQKDKSNKGTKGEDGVGLGLHLVKDLVQLNKGKITVDSILGQGTTFQVLLPNAS